VTIHKKHSREHEKKKESRDAALMKGTEDLMAAGLDLESLAPAPESVARMAGLRLPSREAERAVACWLGFVEIPESAALLLEMEAKCADKDLKREVRRSLFRLEQRGVSLPQRAPETAGAPVLAKEEDRGYVSHVDGRGDLVVWYVRPQRSGDYYILSGVVNHRRGLLEADAGQVARPALRDLLEGTRRRFSIRLLPADAAWCDLVLHEAYKQCGVKRSAGVSRFPSFRMEISHRVPGRVPCPVHALLAGELTFGNRELLESSGRLLEEPELSGWLLDADWMEPHLESLRDLADSPLVLNRFQQEERREKGLQAATAAIFDGEAREIYRKRLEATAYFFLLGGREEAARRALSVHGALSPESPDPPGSLAFVAALARRSFTAAEETRQARALEEKRGSLIVKPGE
jgi:hypothetical protein